MTSFSEPRVRRPKAHKTLIQQLGREEEGPFKNMASTLLFAASVGYVRSRREKFSESEEPIRYEVFLRHSPTAVAFIDSLGVLEYPGDASIMSEERLGERIAVFEEYANGGLSYIQGQINASKSRVMDVLLEMVRRASETQKKPDDLPPELGAFFTPPEF
ncbi:DNA phosphorothioation-associated protein 4 [Sphaerimonospora mesophila]|uniref:DNA phosphorothioation-associated protein 4 n=1 Tax=Sphaerimonospora mesophila TaxID=37483 RepID=UPI000AD6783E